MMPSSVTWVMAMIFLMGVLLVAGVYIPTNDRRLARHEPESFPTRQFDHGLPGLPQMDSIHDPGSSYPWQSGFHPW
jgi:hypothetical protein